MAVVVVDIVAEMAVVEGMMMLVVDTVELVDDNHLTTTKKM